jgi:undecaprenyl-diphosphatase
MNGDAARGLEVLGSFSGEDGYMHALLGLASPWAYIVVGLLAAAEAAAFVGLFIPGEAAMLLGGVLVYQGRVELAPMLIAGCVGAMVGDSIGYEIGRRWGPRLERSRLGQRVGEKRWERAREYVRSRGGRAVFFGRFVGVLRALVPAIAGSAGVPYGTFLIFNVAGGILWATSFILLGVVAGGSWHVVEAWAGRASLALLVLIVLAAAVVAAARWVQGHQEELTATRDWFLERPLMRRLRTRFRPQIDFIKRRLDPKQRAGLFFTVGFIFAIGSAWLFGALLQDVVAHDELALFDRPILRFFITHRSPVLTQFMKAITLLGGSVFVAAAALTVAVVSYVRTRSRRDPLFLAAVLAGALVLDDIIKALIDRPRPSLAPLVHAPGSSFPSGHATAATALLLSFAYLASRGRSWHTAVWFWAGAVFISMLVAVSRVYLGVHWPTDVLAGMSLGAFWVFMSAAIASALVTRE